MCKRSLRPLKYIDKSYKEAYGGNIMGFLIGDIQ